jgi:hypothetical protein
VGIPAWANAQDIENLRQALIAFHDSSDRYARALVRLTVVLVVLTLAVMALTVVVAVKT